MNTTNFLHSAVDDTLAYARAIGEIPLRALFANHPRRFESFSLKAGAILADFSKQRIDRLALQKLLTLAHAAGVREGIRRMVDGDIVNPTENRAALHMALRYPGRQTASFSAPGFEPFLPEIEAELARMRAFCEEIHGGRKRGATGKLLTDVIHIGIGGSEEGPRLVVEALKNTTPTKLRVHFVANVDGAALAPLMRTLDPAQTLVVAVGKSFSTQEMVANADAARAWLTEQLPAEAVARQLVAITANRQAAEAFGAPPDQTFAFGDFVGGRFSVWSPVGLTIALAYGFPVFRRLLSGAQDLDAHFVEAPLEANLPVLLALIDFWNVNGQRAASRCVLPYSQSLAGFLPWLQQLEMESLGKSVDLYGHPAQLAACPVVWGGVGTPGQHAFHQLLHQGGAFIPCEFLLLKKPDAPLADHHQKLLANALGQAAALAFGLSPEEAKHLPPWRAFPGNQPSTTLLIDELSARTLGQLMALYEHKVYCLSILWQLDAFDQWGVELGKKKADTLLPLLTGQQDIPETLDTSTAGLIRALSS
jgi:glucose-6-phosphate isomerase